VITKEMIDRINRLARKQRSEGLTPEEKLEQHNLRRLYLKNIRTQITDQLDSLGCRPKSGYAGNCARETCKNPSPYRH